MFNALQRFSNWSLIVYVSFANFQSTCSLRLTTSLKSIFLNDVCRLEVTLFFEYKENSTNVCKEIKQFVKTYLFDGTRQTFVVAIRVFVQQSVSMSQYRLRNTRQQHLYRHGSQRELHGTFYASHLQANFVFRSYLPSLLRKKRLRYRQFARYTTPQTESA